MFYIVSTCHAIRANDVIYMEERNGDPSKATHTVNDADTRIPPRALTLSCFGRR